MLARSTLLRRTAATLTTRQRSRQFATNAHKRALSKRQLEGKKDGSSGIGARTPADPMKGTAVGGGGSSTKPANVQKASSGGGGGAGSILIPVMLLGNAGFAGLYFTDMIPDEYLPAQLKRNPEAFMDEALNAVSIKEEAMKKELKEVEKEAVAAVASVEKSVEESPPSETTEEKLEEAAVEHPENGNRVDIDKINSFYQTVNAGRAKQEEEEAREAASRATEYNESNKTNQPATDPMSANAMSELQSSNSLENSKTLAAAKAALRSDLDAEYFSDLDQLSKPDDHRR